MIGQTYDPTTLPDLALAHACDWLAVNLRSLPGPIACLARDRDAAAELARRVPGVAFTQPGPPGLAPALDALGLLPTEPFTPAPGALAGLACLWPTPERLAAALDWLAPDGTLLLVLAGPLARFTTQGRAAIQAGSAAVRVASARRLLSHAGLRPRPTLALLGPPAVAWGLAARLATALGRPHLAARCHHAMRRDYVRRAGRRPLAAWLLLAADRGPLERLSPGGRP